MSHPINASKAKGLRLIIDGPAEEWDAWREYDKLRTMEALERWGLVERESGRG